MKIGGYVFPSYTPYDKPCFEIYVSGCNRSCVDCHNHELANFEYGTEIEIDDWIKKYLLTREAFFDIIAITGGDLLCHNHTEAFEFASALRKAFPNKEMWLFTGEDDWNKIPKWASELFDVIKYGSYKRELKQAGFPSSSNQTIWRKNEK
jgi:organic radical activating enzyme